MDGSKQFEFGDFTIDTQHRRLKNAAGKQVQLTPKVYDLLIYLVENAAKALSKDELMAAVWPGTIVEESNLSQNISILRKALGDNLGENAYIATIPGTGYKFVAEVREAKPEEGAATVEPARPAAPAVLPLEADNAAAAPQQHQLAKTLAALAVLLVLIAAGAYFYRYRNSAASNSTPKTLAILPFKPLVADTIDQALEMGMTDTLIARLSGSGGIILRPLSAVRKFTAADQDPTAAGRELGADAVLEGSVQRWGDKIRVNARLIDVASGEAIWSGTFDDEYTDIFAVQDAISSKVANALRLKLARGASDGSSRGATRNVDAYRLFLQGRLSQFNATPKDIYQAIGYYQQAVDLDPDYALAYAAMADSYRMLPITSDVPATEAFPKCKAAALKALEMDPNLSEAHLALGYVASWYEWDWKTAESEMREAIELNPNSEDAHRGLSILLTTLGRHDEAIREMNTALELNPLSLPTGALEAQTLHYAGRDAEAIDRLKKTFEIEPNYWIGHLMLGRIYLKQNKLDDALAELEMARTVSGGNTEAISLIGYANARSGKRSAALQSVDELKQTANGPNIPGYNIALVYLGLGQTNDALDWLEKAVEVHDVRLILLKVETKWDNLRPEPRFIAIMQRLHFQQ